MKTTSFSQHLGTPSAGVYGGTAAHKTILAGLQTLFRQGDLILLELVGNPP